jgi:hypothetical protein
VCQKRSANDFAVDEYEFDGSKSRGVGVDEENAAVIKKCPMVQTIPLWLAQRSVSYSVLLPLKFIRHRQILFADLQTPVTDVVLGLDPKGNYILTLGTEEVTAQDVSLHLKFYGE